MDNTLTNLPLTGTAPVRYDRQASRVQLQSHLRHILNHPDVEQFGWDQEYTPIEEDQPSVWQVNRVWVRMSADKDRTEYELRLHGNDHPTLGRVHTDGPPPDGVKPTPEQVMCWEFYNAVRSVAFREVLLDLFGARARVTVSPAMGVHLCEPDVVVLLDLSQPGELSGVARVLEALETYHRGDPPTWR